LLEQQEAELAALRGVPVAELDDQRREAVHQAVAEALGTGAYDCHRVWEAWGVGTMGPDDFVPVAEDSDRVAEIADAAIDAIRAIPLPAPQAGEVEA
jgi:predicted signal transduction protein with EAL and GGDEF domain